MYYQRKLKQDFRIAGLIPAIIIIMAFFTAMLLDGIRTGYFVLAAGFQLYAAFSLFIYARTRNTSYLAAFFFQALYGLHLLFSPKGILGASDRSLSNFFLLCAIGSTIWLVWLLVQRKAKWKGRELFELAAKSIPAETDGFTARPRPVGHVDCTREELAGFAEFMRRNLIAMPVMEENRLVLVVVKMGEELGYLFSPGRFRSNGSWVSFGSDGTVTVGVSRKDYMDFREELSFDQLCDNLGVLFIRFLEQYRKGSQERILDTLDELRLGLTS